MQTGQYAANVGSRLKRVKARKAPSEKPAFQPYRGKPAVRNVRGDRGNVGIIRSPVRASILPDRIRCCRWLSSIGSLRGARFQGRKGRRPAMFQPSSVINLKTAKALKFPSNEEVRIHRGARERSG